MEKLRIGILLDSYLVPAWSYKMIDKIINDQFAQVVTIVKNDNSEPIKRAPFWRRLFRNRKTVLFNLYHRLDSKLFKPTPNAFELRDIRDLVKIDPYCVKPISSKYSDKLNKDDSDYLYDQKLDILIRLGFRILRGEILKVAKYGIWSYHHGDNQVNRGGPAGTWEVFEQWPSTGVVLQILSENLDGGKILRQSHSLTDPLSVIRNKNNSYWKAMSFIPDEIKKLQVKGAQHYFESLQNDNNTLQFYSNRLFTTPGNWETLRALCRLSWSKLSQIASNQFFFWQWSLMFRFEANQDISTSFFRYKHITPPKDRFWADPFVLTKNGRYYIFIEELIYNNGKGHISVLEIDERGNYSEPIKVLEKDYHLSYPFVFEHQEEVYMIPETSQNKSIELYKCTSFPNNWILERIILDNIKAVDATVHFYEGKYWLFANVVENEGASSLDELHLYYADNFLTDTWTAHPQNPIISDVSSARPAGKLFEHNGSLYRPSQNCSKRYGYGMKINQVLELSPTQYSEKIVSHIYPNWEKNINSTHTFNYASGLSVIDVLRKRRKF